MQTCKVLLVDDEPDFLDSIRTIFEVKGLSVQCAISGEEAIDLIRKTGFDIIFTDMSMKGMDGLQFAGLAKNLLPDAAVYLLTGNSVSPELASLALETGIARIFTKPVNIDVLLDVVRR